MDHTRQAEPPSGELTAEAEAERQAEAREIAQSIAGAHAAGPAKASRYSPVTVSGSAARESSPVNDFVDFLKFGEVDLEEVAGAGWLPGGPASHEVAVDGQRDLPGIGVGGGNGPGNRDFPALTVDRNLIHGPICAGFFVGP